ncbi:MAG: response regulator [Bacteroidetes bacterium]|nr:response regulator [Bacteroidota bacterium]
MKYLIIDDLAHSGWQGILEKAIIKSEGELDSATNYNEAIEKIQNKYDIIFLDVRLTEEDHKVKNIYEYSGFKILEIIKKEFKSINFSTPIILITASNKIWNINLFIDHGVDAYYIKEHPDHYVSNESSRENLINFQSKFIDLIETSKKKNQIWELCNQIIEKLDLHQYFKNKNDKYYNVKLRIIDKLLLGYSILFQPSSEVSREILLSNNETLSFIVFFSILEEITKGFTKITDTWNDKYERQGNWKFRNNEYLIEIDHKSNSFTLNFYKKKKHQKFDIDKLPDFNVIGLSDQIYSLLFAYNAMKELEEHFREVNKYRNGVDYIHSSVNNIFNKKLIPHDELDKSFEMNIEILSLIKKILEIKIK